MYYLKIENTLVPEDYEKIKNIKDIPKNICELFSWKIIEVKKNINKNVNKVKFIFPNTIEFYYSKYKVDPKSSKKQIMNLDKIIKKHIQDEKLKIKAKIDDLETSKEYNFCKTIYLI